MIRAVLFDLDDTLLDRETCIRNFIEDQFNRFERQLSPVGRIEFVSRFRVLDHHGYVCKPVVYEQMRAEFGFSNPLSKALIEDYSEAYARFCVGFPNLTEILTRLRDREIKLAIVTNGSSDHQRAAIRTLNIAPFFGAIVISGVEGVRKPDRAIFDLAMHRLGVTAADATFVGNHPETDIRGAQQAGIRSIWKRDAFWGPCDFADAEIADLLELLDALDRLGTAKTSAPVPLG